MPKKLHTNPKAEAARERKETAKSTAKSTAATAAENSKWADEGQSRSEQRAAAAEQKRQEELKKREARRLLQLAEDTESNKLKLAHSAKVTQFQLRQQQDKLLEDKKELERLQALKEANILIQPELLTENYNQSTAALTAEEESIYGRDNVINANSLDEAIQALSIAGIGSNSSTATAATVIDKHPEKRLKSVFADYTVQYLPQLQLDYPNLKRSQYNELLWKQFQKAPENPINIRTAQLAAREMSKK